MTSQIIPKVFNGNNKLIFTESVCFLPADGLQIKLPISNSTSANQKEISLSFFFEFTEGGGASITEFVAEGDQLKLTLLNFNSTLGVGTILPIDFKIGLDSYHLLIFAQGLESDIDKTKRLLNMTISMYSNGGRFA